MIVFTGKPRSQYADGPSKYKCDHAAENDRHPAIRELGLLRNRMGEREDSESNHHIADRVDNLFSSDRLTASLVNVHYESPLFCPMDILGLHK